MTRPRGSWERDRSEIHSPAGVEKLKESVKAGLTRKYTGIIESMFRFEFDGEVFEDMRVMSMDTVPYQFLFRNGMCVWFKDDRTGQIHCLPLVMNGGINMYGKMSAWYPVPVGWTDDKRSQFSPEVQRIRDTLLTAENSVIMKNDIFGKGDFDYVESMVNELVDNVLTMNQLQLLAAYPFIFNVTEDNVLTAKNFFLAVAEHKPVIFTNALGDKVLPAVEKIDAKIDPALFELFDRFECQLLESVGFPCVPITKRAQQSVSEVQSHDEMVYTKRQERYLLRAIACERISRMFGVSIRVVSVIDEEYSKQETDTQKEDEKDDI